MKVKVYYRPEIVCTEVEVDDTPYAAMLTDVTLTCSQYDSLANQMCTEIFQKLDSNADYICAVEDANTGELLIEN